MKPTETIQPLRKVYLVLSARSLPYARSCLKSLSRNAIEPIDVTLITDGPDDVAQLSELVSQFDAAGQSWRVFGKADADEKAALLFADFPAIAAFREGHPCWRKVTDPPLFAKAGEEIIVLDPDVYFPNRFCFEPTPDSGLLLMWQQPNCLLPEDITRQAFEQDIDMADHTDIGVAQMRFPLPWSDLEDIIVKLGGTALPRSMHVESIVWAALAMIMGGGYLDPGRWHCYRNTVTGRIARRMGQDGALSLAQLPISSMKCLHGGGIAKNWFPEAEAKGILDGGASLAGPSPIGQYESFPRTKFERKFAIRHAAERLGIYRLLGEG